MHAAGIAMLFAVIVAPSASFAVPPRLTVAAESRTMIWNAVAVDGGRIFVAGPRWSGSTGPALALLDRHGDPQPYPDAHWNGWRSGDDPRNVFVNVNSLHRDDSGGLWVIDTGSPEFGGDPLPGAAKAVRIDLKSGGVTRIVSFGPTAIVKGSYVDDIRFHGDHAYLTDAGRSGLIILNLKTGQTRRVLDGHPSTTAGRRNIVLDGEILRGPDGQPLKVNCDPMEVSPDGRWLYFGPLEGPWSRIETRYLDDPAMSPDEIAEKVDPWADLPAMGGSAMDASGNLYFSDLARNALKRRATDGTITTIIQDPALHWVDAPFIDEHRIIWLPVPQIDRAAMFHGGESRIVQPVQLLKMPLDAPK
ncbi:hypothetical protein AA23498_1157 [Acetobacter nitrogenifigens DSM 23921 = NBRC 105050]|uniref:Yellow n=1 Tax=Acetobacter nitrogenifigens DSM 23921 = NBRC 105050 TaxID=1120919 RepID=A0A511XAC8_9PROT|nr:L-dopachrome tautomerase-related protein [Acetobacter nitrogenifigens]GBQ91343.1 hypothetical protein AA23498_1157 [Acetobacter nitrogenifigens DSM 23921 = NBRC 105050]GEN59914.1 hypothetical protein ANI02nite_17980 [Acetobacter nitrogenifigens DSM 23921 = NBRC 105050]